MSTTRSALLIFNPLAGRGHSRRAAQLPRLSQYLRDRGIELEAVATTGPRDATRLAHTAARDGVRDVIVSGGDGTINEALQGLIGTNVRLSVWPAGTENVLARQLRLPFDPQTAAEVIARAHTQRLHIGCAVTEATGEKRYFFLMAGIGLDAAVVESVPPRLKRRVGEAAFWYAGLGHLARWRPASFTVEINGQKFTATFASMGKSSRYGGDLAITPGARLEAREFEVCVVNSQSRLRYLYLLLHAMRGGVAEHLVGVRFIRARQVRAVGDALVQADGEVIGRLPMTFEVVADPVEVITP